MGDLVEFPFNKGNGARETLAIWFGQHQFARPEMGDIALEPADLFLIWLWEAGFRVVPHD